MRRLKGEVEGRTGDRVKWGKRKLQGGRGRSNGEEVIMWGLYGLKYIMYNYDPISPQHHEI